MSNRKVGQFDLETGEILGGEGFIAYVVPKRHNGFREGWIAMAQEAAMLFAKSDLSGGDFRVLMALMAKLDFENLLVISQADLGREIDMDPAHIRRAIRKLKEMDALLEGPRIGIHRSYRLNPRFGWKGSAKGHVIALNEVRRERMKGDKSPV